MFTHTSPSWIFVELFQSLVQEGTAFDDTNGNLAFGLRVKKVALAGPYFTPSNADEAADVTMRKMVTVEGGFHKIRIAFVAPTDPLLNFVSVRNKQSRSAGPDELTRMCIGRDGDGNPCFVLIGTGGDTPA